jgi:hypothetical protein
MDTEPHVVSHPILRIVDMRATVVSRTLASEQCKWRITKLTTCRNLKTKTSRKHPKEYKQARARYPSPEY